MKRRKVKIKKIFPVFILFSILFFSIGYAAINSIEFNISGKVEAKAIKTLSITEVEQVGSMYVNTAECKVNNFFNSSLDSTVSLSQKHADSSLTYRITLRNPTSIDYVFKRAIYGEEWYDNPNIVFVLRNIDETTTLKKGGELTFDITFYYKDNVLQENNILNSIINFEFEQAHNYLNEEINKNVNTRDDLFYDGTPDNNIRFRGNANNWVSFNDSLWRVIGLMNNIEDYQGNKGSKIKLVYGKNDLSSVWDNSSIYIDSLATQGPFGSNSWAKSNLRKSLNIGAYWNNETGTCPNGTECDMSGKGLTTYSKKFIVQSVWNTVGINDYRNATGKELYVDERTAKAEGTGYQSTMKSSVGLIYPSDYAYASQYDKCINTAIKEWNSDCYDTNWLVKGNLDGETVESIWTINHYLNTKTDVISIGGESKCAAPLNKSASCNHYVRPTIYLNDDVIIKSGSGTYEDPWQIALTSDLHKIDWNTYKITWLGDMLLGNNNIFFDTYLKKITEIQDQQKYIEEKATLELIKNKVSSIEDKNRNLFIINGGVVDLFSDIMEINSSKEVGSVNMNSDKPKYDNTLISDLEEIIYNIKTSNPKAKVLYLNLFDYSKDGIKESIIDYLNSSGVDSTTQQTEEYLNSKYMKVEKFYQELQNVVRKYNINYLDLKNEISASRYDFLDKGFYLNSFAYESLVNELARTIENNY